MSSAVRPASSTHRRVSHVMGMPISLALRGRHADDEHGEHAWQQALQSLVETDRVFSTYRTDSLISRLDRGELTVADCPTLVHEVLELAERARRESGGAFDVLRPGPGGRRVLDPSGVVKGWAVERAARGLRRLPATDFCLSAGGDMVCRTRLAGSPAWQIGVEDPFDPRRVVAVVPIRDGAIATSGLQHRGAHIVDARTGTTPTQIASVTVVAADLVAADIDTTAAFALADQGLAWLQRRPGRCGLVVWANGRQEVF